MDKRIIEIENRGIKNVNFGFELLFCCCGLKIDHFEIDDLGRK